MVNIKMKYSGDTIFNSDLLVRLQSASYEPMGIEIVFGGRIYKNQSLEEHWDLVTSSAVVEFPPPFLHRSMVNIKMKYISYTL